MVYFIADNIISPLGLSTSGNFEQLLRGVSGIKEIAKPAIYPGSFPASIINTEKLEETFAGIPAKNPFTRLEKMMILSVRDALSRSGIDIGSKKTGLVVATTKGNIDLLEEQKNNLFEPDRLYLWKLGRVLAGYFNNPNEPIVLSNACISGVLAINLAAELIQEEQFDNVVIVGGDIVSRFVVSGFMSFMSLSPKACKPFDKKRDGLSLGEAAATVILSSKRPSKQAFRFMGGASANDANHISGPSRTGAGSYIAIKKALAQAEITAGQIDHISAHGTATVYNDEMESIAIDRLGMNQVPVSSFKGNFGHTLGAAGLVETAILLEEMRNNLMVKTTGFHELGVSKDIHIVDQTTNKELKTCLKMASGFGGSNAALIIQKVIFN